MFYVQQATTCQTCLYVSFILVLDCQTYVYVALSLDYYLLVEILNLQHPTTGTKRPSLCPPFSFCSGSSLPTESRVLLCSSSTHTHHLQIGYDVFYCSFLEEDFS
jgi:hypothetical protein